MYKAGTAGNGKRGCVSHFQLSFLVSQDVFCGKVWLSVDRRPVENGEGKAVFSAVIVLPGRLLWLCL